MFNVLDEDVILSLSAAKGKDLCIAVWKECRMHRFLRRKQRAPQNDKLLELAARS